MKGLRRRERFLSDGEDSDDGGDGEENEYRNENVVENYTPAETTNNGGPSVNKESKKGQGNRSKKGTSSGIWEHAWLTVGLSLSGTFALLLTWCICMATKIRPDPETGKPSRTC